MNHTFPSADSFGSRDRSQRRAARSGMRHGGRQLIAAALRNTEDEDGAILILALIFVIIVTLSIFGLITFGGTGLLNASNLKGQRSLEYAADGAVTAAVQAVRYSNFDPSQTTLYDCLPNGEVLAPTTTNIQSMTINNVTVWVDCTGIQPPPNVSRAVTFYACIQSTCTSNNSTVVATVYFYDTTSSGVTQCLPPTLSATCGYGMTIQSWVVESANN